MSNVSNPINQLAHIASYLPQRLTWKIADCCLLQLQKKAQDMICRHEWVIVIHSKLCMKRTVCKNVKITKCKLNLFFFFSHHFLFSFACAWSNPWIIILLFMDIVFSDIDCKTFIFFPLATFLYFCQVIAVADQENNCKRESSSEGQLWTHIVLFQWCFIASLLVWHHLTTINPSSVCCQINWKDIYEPIYAWLHNHSSNVHYRTSKMSH